LTLPHLLSTPSLGITVDEKTFRKIANMTAFQLPLSGSRTTVALPEEVDKTLPFNSLSRDHITGTAGRGEIGDIKVLSTPSLGITSPAPRAEGK